MAWPISRRGRVPTLSSDSRAQAFLRLGTATAHGMLVAGGDSPRRRRGDQGPQDPFRSRDDLSAGIEVRLCQDLGVHPDGGDNGEGISPPTPSRRPENSARTAISNRLNSFSPPR